MFRLIKAFYVLLLGTLANANELDILRQNCIACHGGIKDGKKVVKGSFDITSVLKDGIQEKHASDWVAMLDQIREKRCPRMTANTH